MPESSSASWIAGGDFAGNVLDGTLHAEWSYTNPGHRASFWKAGLGYDYTFRDASVVAEYFHSDSGALDTRRYDVAWIIRLSPDVPGRHSRFVP